MKFVLISIFLTGFILKINLIYSLPIFGEIQVERRLANDYLAKKYCDSLEKNLFKGLDKELTLKYEYFFSSIPEDYIKNEDIFLENFKSDVKSLCSYDISKSNEKEFKYFLNNYFKNKSSTPKTKVEAINPTPINTAMIPVLR